MAVKLPNAAVLAAHLKSGMDRNQIADRYGAHRDTVRLALIRYNLVDLAPAKTEGPARRITRHLSREMITVQEDRLVILREMVAGEHGGVAIRQLSLPRVSMHVAALQERGLDCAVP